MISNMTPAKTEAKPLTRRADDVFGTMRREIDHLFDRWGNGSGWPYPFAAGHHLEFVAPDMDVKETANEFLIEAELPGVDEKDIAVTLTNGVLSLKGEKKQERNEKKDSYHVIERSFGSFERSLRLPDTADETKVGAKFANGVLKIAVGKRADAVKPERKIEIKKV